MVIISLPHITLRYEFSRREMHRFVSACPRYWPHFSTCSRVRVAVNRYSGMIDSRLCHGNKMLHLHLPCSGSNPDASSMHRFVKACPRARPHFWTCSRIRFVVSRSLRLTDSCLCHGKSFHCHVSRSDSNPVASMTQRACPRYFRPHFSTCSGVRFVVSCSRDMIDSCLCHGKCLYYDKSFPSFHHFTHRTVTYRALIRIRSIRDAPIRPGAPQLSWPHFICTP